MKRERPVIDFADNDDSWKRVKIMSIKRGKSVNLLLPELIKIALDSLEVKGTVKGYASENTKEFKLKQLKYFGLKDDEITREVFRRNKDKHGSDSDKNSKGHLKDFKFEFVVNGKCEEFFYTDRNIENFN